MRQSNGLRPVNKTDGGKKRAKKAMRKSRRVDSIKIINECTYGRVLESTCPDCLDRIKKIQQTWKEK